MMIKLLNHDFGDDLSPSTKSIEYWKDVVNLNNQDAQAHNNLGNAYSREQQYLEAIEEYETAIRLDPLRPPSFPSAKRSTIASILLP